MTHFAVYDPATGAIKRHGSCAPCDVALQAEAHEAVVATLVPAPGDRYVIDIAASPPVPKPRPPAPDES
ncbi:MAG TPA: hypothetical protein VN802_08655 [Stellaceae bacterium]|nr:hypothetical protein [Stellaceae bacterium]